MSPRKWFICCVGVLILGGMTIVVALIFTMPWDRAWVLRGTTLTLANADVELTGKELTLFLADFQTNDDARAGFRCTLDERHGTLVIDGNPYPVRLITDKFTGESIVVVSRYKTVELFRIQAANHRL